MPFALELEKTSTPVITTSLEPAANGLASLLLLAKHESEPGIHPWLDRTRAQLNEETFFRHKLVITGFFYAILPRQSQTSFPTYLTQLEDTPASTLRDRMLEKYGEIYAKCTGDNKTVNWNQILISPKSYVDFLKKGFNDDKVEDDLETRAFEFVMNPAAMKELITSHLRWFWKNHLEAEWTRVRPMLEKSVRAFQKADLSGMTRLEIARFITGQELSEAHWLNELNEAQKIIFVPNAHNGLYVHKLRVDNSMCVFFGARQPEGIEERIPELDRADIVSKLSALADDTRLEILQLVSENREMRAQDIMEAINLSQPSVSRYLSQLTVSGFLQERRVNSAKAYTLNYERIDKTLKAVSAFLLEHRE